MNTIMKLNRLEAHDRLLHFRKQSDYISQGCQDCIKNRPKEFGNHSFYIFAHTRTEDNGSIKRLIWSPRLTKPKAQTNSMLFKYYPSDDTIRIIWMIPDSLMWPQYRSGNVTEHKIVQESINDFKFNRKYLEKKEKDDLEDVLINQIYREIGKNKKVNNGNQI